jgi:hypothetical protein
MWIRTLCICELPVDVGVAERGWEQPEATIDAVMANPTSHDVCVFISWTFLVAPLRAPLLPAKSCMGMSTTPAVCYAAAGGLVAPSCHRGSTHGPAWRGYGFFSCLSTVTARCISSTDSRRR